MKITRALFLQKANTIKIPSVDLNFSLVNKSWCTAHKITIYELTSILHTALELKDAVDNIHCTGIQIPAIRSKSVTLLLRNSNETLQVPFDSAGRILMIPVRTIVLPNWDTRDHLLDTRKFFEKHTDCLFCESQYLSRSHKIINNSPIPVIFVRSCKYTIITGLAQLMTIYLKFGRLTGLNVLWIGPPSANLNTLLAFCPKLNINFKYCCGFNASAPASPSSLEKLKKHGTSDFESFASDECCTENVAANANNSDVIITTLQEESTLKITKFILEAAKPGCILLHTLPRKGKTDLDEEVFAEGKCLVWEMVDNMKWIYAALMVRLMSEYKHTSQLPMLDGSSQNNNDSQHNFSTDNQ